ncbi:MAG: DUF3943 domain-containing protein [Candidatus Omnitrophica bacterium]|nr:DUF3943 domain-containing protein [Candidatus Omnitrophota bacterium]
MRCRMFLSRIFVCGAILFGLAPRLFGQEQEASLQVKEPLMYCASLMAVGYAALVAAEEVPRPSWHKFKQAYRSGPVWDDDSAVYNFILHPLWGSETYLRARTAEWGIPGSIAFSQACSFVWEYAYEAWSQHPSTQDLLFTAGLGWIIGEGRYRLKQKLAPAQAWLVDPMYTLLEHLEVVRAPAGARDACRIGLRWEI